MTTLVLQTSTPPVQFDIVFFGHVLELRSEYVLNTLLITRPSRFAAFWSHVLEFTCVSSFWPAHRSFSNFGDLAWESLSACVLVTFWLRFEHVLEPGVNKCFYVPWRCVNNSWMATTSAAAVAAAEFRPDLCPWPRSVSTVNDPCRIGVTFWARTRSLFHGASRAWNSEPSLTHVFKLRFGYVLEQNISFGRHNRPRFESTF